MSENNQNSSNPLQKYYRQPKLYIKLPSNGKFYPPGTLDFSETGEYAIYSMTAKDELAFKTPDALLNGQSTVDVIQSCVPAIKNAWLMPTLDLDAVLVAIRIATFGHHLDLETKIPVTGEERSYGLDLRMIMDTFSNASYDDMFEMEGLKIYTRPLNYKEFSENSIKTFEEQRIFKIVNNNDISDKEKMELFQKSFAKLTDINITTVINSIRCIEVEGQEVKDSEQITEFIQNSDKDFYNAITKHLEKQKSKFDIKPLTVETEPEDQEKGAPTTFEIPITFDQANFFA